MLAKPTVNDTRIALIPITIRLMFAVPNQLRRLPQTSGSLTALGAMAVASAGTGCADIFGTQALCHQRHAIWPQGMTCTAFPGANLADQIIARQTKQTRRGRLHAVHGAAVAGNAGRNPLVRIAVIDQHLTRGTCCARQIERLWRRIRWMLLGEIPGDFLQIGVGQMLLEIADRFAGNARIITIVGGTALQAVASGEELFEGIRHPADIQLGRIGAKRH